MPNLDLITEFEELHLNDFDYSLKSHPAHETMEMEQLNILNDLVGLMQESNSKSISDIVMSEKQDNQIVQLSAPKQCSIYRIMEENWESDQARKCTGKPTTCTYVVGYAMVRADAIRKRTQAITRLRDQEIFLEMIDAPREEIRRCIIQKLGPAAWDYHPKAEFLNQKFYNKTLLHTSVKAGKLDITDLLLDYGADPDIEEDGQTIADRAAAENKKLLIRILRYPKYKFSSYNSLGEAPLMVAIAYGHKEVASYLWISSNVAQMAKDNSTVLHYAAKHGNNSLVRAACERKIHININQTTRPGNYTALHLATIKLPNPQPLPVNSVNPPKPKNQTRPYQQTIDDTKRTLIFEFTEEVDKSGPLRKMQDPPKRIELQDNAVLFSIHRPIPLVQLTPVKAARDKMGEDDVIKPMTGPTDWTHTTVAVEESDGTLNICVDLTELNRFSQTTDVFLAHSKRDKAFGELTNTVKGVDDVLLFDDDFESHLTGVIDSYSDAGNAISL
ncbi:hypothetical protein OUZ56_012333 [Daphnia magna]|uniref:Ankyrin repeat domain-containing protein n=1 Tax=Daphnia magna TaxID=35525 RepID=A0ABQ9Z2P7_9CRUS|nr:hypothetical protein OUZ56_012333 [Daphnia magna]